jgi:hypothetical protein
MTLRTRAIVGVGAVLAIMSGATATANAQDLRTHIPFEFKAGETVLPAGTYDITTAFGSPSVVKLRWERGGVILMTNVSSDNKRGDPQLTFRRYGDQYFLRDIRFSGDRTLNLRPSPAELEMQRASNEGKGPAPTLVTVAAHR